MYHKIHWTLEKIQQRIQQLEPFVYWRKLSLPPFRFQELPDASTPPPVEPQVDTSAWPVIEPYSYWGRGYLNFVLRSQFQIPLDWAPDQPVALYLPLGEAGDFSHPEALVYVDGEPYAGCDRHHQEIRLDPRWWDDAPHVLALHGWTGLLGFQEKRPQKKLFMEPCYLVQVHQPTRDFLATARVAVGTVHSLDESQPARGLLLNALDAAFKAVDLREPGDANFYASIPEAHNLLQQGVQKAGPALPVEVVGTGHAHIDVAWLWTLGQTRRKAGRTFHTVLRYMEQFPDYHFTQSQPQLYDYVRQDYPELFQAIKKRVAEGRWEPIGGMWVEADCNLSGSESLARQFLLGRTFFRRHFGPDAESPVLWLPDVFGYAWSLPQLIKEAGLKYFFTIKIGWSQYNRMPYDSFWWQGIDGTQVLTHFSTTPDPWSRVYVGTYNARATPEENLGTWTNFQQKECQQQLLMAFGYGDGGGGPTREMLENIQIMADFPGLPRMRQGSVGNFFQEMERRSGHCLPTWNGELYLELHRGTYTTQAWNKRANRKSEFLLHDAEFLASLASQLDPDYEYPQERLNKAWEVVCLNQFHDIIPGSSIHPVYVESLEQYQTVQETGEAVCQEALAAITAHSGAAHLLAINPTSFPRQDLAFWPGSVPEQKHLILADGTPVPAQATQGGTWLHLGQLPPYSVTSLRLADGPSPVAETGLHVAEDRLENAFLRVELNRHGDITRIYDKVNQREVLPEGEVANQFQAFVDRPLNWDAWDVDIFYEDTMYLAEPASSIQVVEAGPLRATLEIRRRILHSDYVQRISLSHVSPRLDFDTWIDWQERHILLKVAFPVDVLSPRATYEIQWGHVERPTHRNTSWDWARFETAAQKWVDLSEGGYGVSLLNDCKYGHDIKGHVMRISLLRSPTMPDPEADRGEHRFAYSLLPHAGPWDEQTIAEAYALNDPLRVHEVGNGGADTVHPTREADSFLAVDQPNVVIETVKRAEDGRGLIVRLYESRRQRGPVTLRAAFPIAQAWRTNLLEEDQHPLEVVDGQVNFAIRPFQIVTLRLL